ncbi:MULTISPECIES: DUF6134 family protein [unclassified Acidisoma]|jgi:Family of unknown function (DUF6134)|uniref:DUF6134 family protein n=1 Tax=unclassified Acidisoma TaxID=2634065 RepID=UPI00131B35F5|nr:MULTISPECIES: DUF6134 family protein [unclassified Acidisoma]
MIGGFFHSLQSPVVAPEKQSNSVPGRRRFLLGAAAGATALVLDHPALAQVIPASGHATYQLVRHGDVIGHETISFNQSGGMLTVTIEAHIRVTLAMVTIYALDHHETETWQNGTFLSFSSTTNKNGTKFYAQGWRDNGQLMARGTRHPATYVAPPNALPTSQWNHAMLSGPMLNTEDGRLMHPHVVDMGLVSLPTASGGTVTARHFNASGDLRFDTYFTPAWDWVGLSFHADDGSLVTYQKV